MTVNTADFEDTLSSLSETDRLQIFEQLSSPDFSGQINISTNEPIKLAQALLPLAATFSVAPISGFHVGAVAVGASGAFYLGANLEFIGTSLNATLHAEQSAILNAKAHDETSVSILAISAAPCGYCRQFLWELATPKNLLVCVGENQTNLGQLLPMPFGEPRKLGNGMLDSSPSKLQTCTPTYNSTSALHALEAAQRSYVPYTHAHEGVVIECANDQYFVGSTVESIAFNPSVPAVLSALNLRNLSSSRSHEITRCTHAQLANSRNSNCDLSASLIRGISEIKIQTVFVEHR